MIAGVADPAIRAGMEAAIMKNMIPAAVETDYPGYFWISADGRAYGNATWPGLDSWQMAGAYLLLGRTRMVLDYFDFVRASQRKDGHSLCHFSGQHSVARLAVRFEDARRHLHLQAAKARRSARFQPATSVVDRAVQALASQGSAGALAPVCYILTAREIFDATGSSPWLRERIASLEAAAKYLLSRKDKNGLIGGAGFYTELPARYNWDGVAQCYTIHAFRELARLFGAAGNATANRHGPPRPIS